MGGIHGQWGFGQFITENIDLIDGTYWVFSRVDWVELTRIPSKKKHVCVLYTEPAKVAPKTTTTHNHGFECTTLK